MTRRYRHAISARVRAASTRRHPGRDAYTARGYTRPPRAIVYGSFAFVPAPADNVRVARAFARVWLERIGLDYGWGRGAVPMRMHTNADRLVQWARSRVPRRVRATRGGAR